MSEREHLLHQLHQVTGKPVTSLGSFTEQGLAELEQHLAGQPVDAKRIQGFSTGALAYTEFTSPVTISAATEGTANTIVTAAAVSFSGATVVIEFFCPALLAGAAATGTAHITLFDGGTSLGDLFRGQIGSSEASACLVRRVLTPSVGSHTYSIGGYRASNNLTAEAGAGGAGNELPGYIRITTG